MNLNPSYPDPPMDSDSRAMPKRPADLPKGSEPVFTVAGPRAGGGPAAVDVLPEGGIVGRRDAYSETGAWLEDLPKALDEPQEPSGSRP